MSYNELNYRRSLLEELFSELQKAEYKPEFVSSYKPEGIDIEKIKLVS